MIKIRIKKTISVLLGLLVSLTSRITYPMELENYSSSPSILIPTSSSFNEASSYDIFQESRSLKKSYLLRRKKKYKNSLNNRISQSYREVPAIEQNNPTPETLTQSLNFEINTNKQNKQKKKSIKPRKNVRNIRKKIRRRAQKKYNAPIYTNQKKRYFSPPLFLNYYHTILGFCDPYLQSQEQISQTEVLRITKKKKMKS